MANPARDRIGDIDSLIRESKRWIAHYEAAGCPRSQKEAASERKHLQKLLRERRRILA